MSTVVDTSILDKLNEEYQTPVLPANIVKISYDVENAFGKFILVDSSTRDVIEVLGDEIEFVPLIEYGRYVRFNPQTNSSDVVSNFFKPFEASKAIDKFSKKLIAELKKNGIGDIKYRLYFFGLLKKGDDFIPVVFVFSGATLQSLIQVRNEKLAKVNKWRGYYVFRMKPVKQKRGAIVYFSLDIVPEPLNDDDLLKVVKIIPTYLDSIKMYIDGVNELIMSSSNIENEVSEELGLNSESNEDDWDIEV